MIADYVKKPNDENWVPFPLEMFFDSSVVSYYNPKEGLQIIASIKKLGIFNAIHVSFGPLVSYRGSLTEQELYEYSLLVAPDVINLFFPGRGFAKAPTDERNPTQQHYFSLLDDENEQTSYTHKSKKAAE